MGGLADWKPHSEHLIGGLREGNFVSSQFVFLAAGPPFWAQMTRGNQAGLGARRAGMPVYALGGTQSFSMGQQKAIQRIFEIGSDRSYFISGRTVGQVSLGRVLFHGPSLLRAFYAFYDTQGRSELDSHRISTLLPKADYESFGKIRPLGEQASPQAPLTQTQAPHPAVYIPPGYDNMFINLASDLFSQPIGLLCVLRDNQKKDYGAFYLEQCMIPSHQWGFDSTGMVVSEQCSVQYERLIPVQTGQIKLMRDIAADSKSRAPDVTGGFLGGGLNTNSV